MPDNPYQSPTNAPIMGMLHANRGELKAVAQYQKGLLYCILVYVVAIVAMVALPAEVVLYVAIAGWLAALGGTVFVFLLALRIHGILLGILLGILVLIPLVGLIVLLVVNAKATSILRQNGIDVGLMGAKS